MGQPGQKGWVEREPRARRPSHGAMGCPGPSVAACDLGLNEDFGARVLRLRSWLHSSLAKGRAHARCWGPHLGAETVRVHAS